MDARGRMRASPLCGAGSRVLNRIPLIEYSAFRAGAPATKEKLSARARCDSRSCSILDQSTKEM